jgi:excisionase family DNA binding protein
MDDQPSHYTQPEAAKLLRISPNSVARLIKQGELGCLRIGRRCFITRAQIDTYLESRTTPPTRVERNASSASGATGSTGERTRRRGTSPGTTEPPSVDDARRRLQGILTPPSGD